MCCTTVRESVFFRSGLWRAAQPESARDQAGMATTHFGVMKVRGARRVGAKNRIAVRYVGGGRENTIVPSVSRRGPIEAGPDRDIPGKVADRAPLIDRFQTIWPSIARGRAVRRDVRSAARRSPRDCGQRAACAVARRGRVDGGQRAVAEGRDTRDHPCDRPAGDGRGRGRRCGRPVPGRLEIEAGGTSYTADTLKLLGG